MIPEGVGVYGLFSQTSLPADIELFLFCCLMLYLNYLGSRFYSIGGVIVYLQGLVLLENFLTVDILTCQTHVYLIALIIAAVNLGVSLSWPSLCSATAKRKRFIIDVISHTRAFAAMFMVCTLQDIFGK